MNMTMSENTIKIYVTTVDDDPDILTTTEMLIKSTGDDYIIEKFLSGVEFTERLDHKDPMDIVIVDINMPDFNIVDAVKKIDETFPLAYVIVASGDKDSDVITELINNYHIWGYVVKESGFADKLTRLVREARKKVIIIKSLTLWN